MDVAHERLREMVAARRWQQFHSPENLAKSIAIEAGELLERFQWDSHDLAGAKLELADVLTYCLLMADALGVEPAALVLEKLDITTKKYPVDRAKGTATKYDQL